ncbi:MAG: sulfatase-like hydrolase/transferase [Armatimonadota bacterium]
MPEDRYNIVLIMTDQHRRDAVGAYGAKTVQTPNLDRLAEGAVVFDRYYCTSPLCAPARCSIATGRHAHSHGVLLNSSRHPDAKFARLHQDEVPLTDLLVQAGYRVGRVGIDHIRADPPLSERAGLAKHAGRAHYAQYLAAHGVPEADLSAYKRACLEVSMGREVETLYSSPDAGCHPCPPEHFFDTWVAREAVSFLEETPSDEPFALLCYLWLPHPPVVVPEPYFSMYEPADIDPPPHFMAPLEGKPSMHLRHLPGQLGAYPTREQWLRTTAVYYGMVTMADDCIGVVLDALEGQGLADDALIIFVPDHGEMLGCHSLYQKMVCYQDSIRLPCLARAPGMAPGRRGQLACHVDLLPTILDYAGIEAPANLHGISLRPTIEDAAATTHEAVFSEYNGNQDLNYFQRAIITEQHKYIENEGDISELYDLQEDPYELHNLAVGSPGGTERELQRLLRCWQADTGDFLGFRH